MDRFKFRVYHKDHGWLEDCKIYTDGTCAIYNGFSGCDVDIDLNDIIIEQCTGLKDKNGKLIFEGDIINYTVDGETFSGILEYGGYTGSLGFGYSSYCKTIGYLLAKFARIANEDITHKFVEHLRRTYTSMSVGYYFKHETKTSVYSFGLTTANASDMEVIGNIHNNQELLEK